MLDSTYHIEASEYRLISTTGCFPPCSYKIFTASNPVLKFKTTEDEAVDLEVQFVKSKSTIVRQVCAISPKCITYVKLI